MQKTLLEQIKSKVHSFHPLLSHWQRQRKSSLTEDDLLFISIHAANQYKIEIDTLIMFYNRVDALNTLHVKLNEEYPKFQNWAITTFNSCLIGYGIDYGTENFLITNIHLLRIPAKLKAILIQFHCRTIGEILKCYEANDFKGHICFPLVIECIVFLINHNRKNKHYNPLYQYEIKKETETIPVLRKLMYQEN